MKTTLLFPTYDDTDPVLLDALFAAADAVFALPYDASKADAAHAELERLIAARADAPSDSITMSKSEE